MDVKISVIIPAYNVEEYIENCLDSIFAQTMLDFEIICIDDSSGDGTYDIIKKYEKLYSHFKGMRNDCNIGAANTRNRGLAEAVGEYVIFLDADDTYHSQFLEKMYNAVISTRADVSVCQANYYDKDGNVLQCSGWNEKVIKKQYLTTSDDRQNIFQSILYAPWNKLVRREFLLDNHILFQDLPNANDVYYSMMVTACASKIAFVSDVLVFYQYEREGNLSDSKKKKRDYTIWAYGETLVQLKKRNLWKGDITKSFLNDVISFAYHRVVYSSDDLSNIYISDYRGKIMPLLSDEEVRQNVSSKWIYYNYTYLSGKCSLCNNMYQMYIGEIEDYLAEKKKEKLALWGAGRLGQKFVDAIPSAKQSISYIVDNDTNKHGKTLCGIEICSYESVKNIVDKYLVLNETFIEEIIAQVGDETKVVNMREVYE